MSEFFDEIDEEVRREQLKKLWDRYSLFIIAAALLIVAAVGGWRGYQYLEAKKAAEAGDAFNKAIELSEQGKHAEAETAFIDLAAKAPAGYRTLARFRAAAEAASSDAKAGAKMFDDIAAHGHATGGWTLNTLTLFGDRIALDAADPMGEDRFHRFNQTLQEFVDAASRLRAAA